MGIRKKQLHFLFKKINRETDSSDQKHNFLLIVNQRHLQVHVLYGLKNKSICTLYYHTVPWAKNKKNRKRTAQSYTILSKHL